jgi:outer membrane immunogenic protein
MLRKTHFAYSLLLAAMTVNATPYWGIGIGPDTINFKQNAHITQLSTFNVTDITHLAGTGFFGTFFAGYYWLHNTFFLAVEGNGNLSAAEFQSSNSNITNPNISNTHYIMDNTYGVSILPGYQFSPSTLFYGRVGYANAHFEVNSSDVSLENVSRRLDGLRYGLGVKQAITEHIALRLDYSRINYSNTNLRTYETSSSTNKITSIKPRQQLVEFGIIYALD